MDFITELRELLGRYALTEEKDIAPYVIDDRRRYIGDAVAVALPGSHDEVVKVLKLTEKYQIPVIPQSGNTSNVGGSVPDKDSGALVLSLKRMRRIIAVDPVNDTIHAEAGVTLQELQDAAQAHDRLFPLTLASQGSAAVGGLLANNAGGTQVLRYGMTRDLTLGYRAVLVDGREINELNALRKNNSGYDLRDVLIGSEGTLAVITEAVLKLFPRPKDTRALILSLADLKSVETVFNAFNDQMHAEMTAFELLSKPTLTKLAQQCPEVRQPDIEKTDWSVLIEFSFFDQRPTNDEAVEAILEGLIDAGHVIDGVISQSENDVNDFWRVREMIPPAHKKAGGNVKHDIAVPRSRLVEFIETVCGELQTRYEWLEPSVFGHFGDGNLHFNMGVKPELDQKIVFTHEKDIHAWVHQRVLDFGGTISAEHGIGQLKRETMRIAKDPVALEMMRGIKRVFDPNGRLNPNRLLPD